jgi:hypothetical protein
MMFRAEIRGEYDCSRTKDALILVDDLGYRTAVFLSEDGKSINIAIDLPHKCGTKCFSLNMDEFKELLLSATQHNAAGIE